MSTKVNMHLRIRHSFLFVWSAAWMRGFRATKDYSTAFATEPQGYGSKYQGLRLCLH
jgi:hypothetical protein